MEDNTVNQTEVQPDRLKKILSRHYFKYYGIGLIIILLLVLGFILRNHKNQTEQFQSKVKSNTALTPSPSTTPSQTTFQTILTEHCGTDVPRLSPREFDRIYLENIPLDLSKTKVTPIYLRDNIPTALCDGFIDKQRYVILDVVDGNTQYSLIIYDDLSVTPGRGGGPYIEQYGEVIKENDDVKITAQATADIAPPIPLLASSVKLEIIGTRKILLSNGESIYIKITMNVREPGDPLVLDLLKPYTVTKNLSQYELGIADVVDNPAELDKTFKKYFFDDLENLRPLEKLALEKIETALASYKTKESLSTNSNNIYEDKDIGLKTIQMQYADICENKKTDANDIIPKINFSFNTLVPLKDVYCDPLSWDFTFIFNVGNNSNDIVIYPSDYDYEYKRIVSEEDGVVFSSSIDTFAESCPIREPIALEYIIKAKRTIMVDSKHSYTFLVNYVLVDEKNKKFFDLMRPHLNQITCLDNNYLGFAESFYDNEEEILDKIDLAFADKVNQVVYEDMNIKEVIKKILSSVEIDAQE